MRSTTSSAPFADGRRRRSTGTLLLLAAALLGTQAGSCSCSGDQGAKAATLEERARAALDRGAAAVAGEKEPELGSLHALQRAAALGGKAGLREFVERERRRFENDLYRALLFDGLAPVPLLEKKGRGERRLQWHLTHAATKVDPPRSQAAVEEFLALDLHGFLLTHQLYAVVWMREAGIPESEAIRARVPALVAKLRGEIEALTSFSDLFAEQVCVLAWIDPREAIPPAWIEIILKAQGPDGLWRDPTSYRISFDGETWAAKPSAAHTSAQALGALAQWLHRPGR